MSVTPRFQAPIKVLMHLQKALDKLQLLHHLHHNLFVNIEGSYFNESLT